MKKFLFVTLLSLVMIGFTSCISDNGTKIDSADADTVCISVMDTIPSDTIVKDSLVQCKAITKKGTQCERLVDYPDTLCFQHKK